MKSAQLFFFHLSDPVFLRINLSLSKCGWLQGPVVYLLMLIVGHSPYEWKLIEEQIGETVADRVGTRHASSADDDIDVSRIHWPTTSLPGSAVERRPFETEAKPAVFLQISTLGGGLQVFKVSLLRQTSRRRDVCGQSAFHAYVHFK